MPPCIASDLERVDSNPPVMRKHTNVVLVLNLLMINKLSCLNDGDGNVTDVTSLTNDAPQMVTINSLFQSLGDSKQI